MTNPITRYLRSVIQGVVQEEFTRHRDLDTSSKDMADGLGTILAGVSDLFTKYHDNIPYMACWMCQKGIYQNQPSRGYLNKRFCGETCVNEYMRIAEIDQNPMGKKLLAGNEVQIFNPTN